MTTEGNEKKTTIAWMKEMRLTFCVQRGEWMSATVRVDGVKMYSNAGVYIAAEREMQIVGWFHEMEGILLLFIPSGARETPRLNYL